MADNNFTISFEGVEGYTGPIEGGGGLVPYQGLTYGEIVSITPGVSMSEAKNHTLKFEIMITEPEGKGFKVTKTQAVSGLRKDKKPNALGLIDIFYSVYSGSAKNNEEALAKARAHEGTSIDVEGIRAEMVGQKVYFSIKARKYLSKDSGREGWTTDLDNFISRFRYDEAKAANVHHRPNPEESQRTSEVVSAATVSSNGAAKPAGSARSVL